MKKTPTLREQLEPLAADLEKARKVIKKVADILRSHHPATSTFSFEVGVRSYYDENNGAAFWYKPDTDRGEFHQDFDSVISTAENFSPVDAKAARIAKLKAELAELEGK